MKKIIPLALIMSLLVSVLFFSGGCNPGEKIAEEITERAIEQGSGADVDISEDEMTIKTDEGETTIGSGTELPDDFPSAVPVYPDMQILNSSKVTQDGKAAFTIGAETTDSHDKVVGWYKSELGNWKIDSEFTSESDGLKYTMVTASNDAYNLWMQFTEEEGKNYIMLSVEEK
jgi:flavodoxin